MLKQYKQKNKKEINKYKNPNYIIFKIEGYAMSNVIISFLEEIILFQPHFDI